MSVESFLHVDNKMTFVFKGGSKLERARDLFEQCLEKCPPKYAKRKLFPYLSPNFDCAFKPRLPYGRGISFTQIKSVLSCLLF